MQELTGSLGLRKEATQTPFEKAQSDILMFMVGLQTCSAFEELANRIQTIDAIMKLPVMHLSSSAETIKIAKNEYEQEMKEIELALKLMTQIPGIPEA